MKDLIIIGSGPAGLAAAVYAGRAQLDTMLIEKTFHGGQMLNTNEVENYPGFVTTGPELSMQMYEHAKQFGVEPTVEEVTKIEVDGKVKKVVTTSTTYEAKAVILAMGAKPRQLGLSNEESLWGRGISYCAICDGGFFRDRVVAIVGGGDTAVEDALYMSRIAKKVYLIHRRDELRAAKILQTKLFEAPNVEILWDTVIDELIAEDTLKALKVRNIKNGAVDEIEVAATFIAIGTTPITDLVKGVVELDTNGYIIAGEDCATNVPGVFAAGDLRKKKLRQIITAAADGAVAVYEAEKYALENF